MPNGDKPLMGKVLEHEGRFFIEVENKLEELDPMLAGGVEVLHKLSGQEVELVVQEIPWIAGVVWEKVRIVCYLPPPEFWRNFGPELVTAPMAGAPAMARVHVHDEAAVTLHLKRPICYVPADWVIRGVEEMIRVNLLKQMFAEGIISQEVYGRLAG